MRMGGGGGQHRGEVAPVARTLIAFELPDLPWAEGGGGSQGAVWAEEGGDARVGRCSGGGKTEGGGHSGGGKKGGGGAVRVGEAKGLCGRGEAGGFVE